MANDDCDELDARAAETYLEITKIRETAEAVHGRETIERLAEEYRQIRAELRTRPPYMRRRELQTAAARLEHLYGYEALAGIPRAIRGDRPPPRWDA